jgi:hypothetical protein
MSNVVASEYKLIILREPLITLSGGMFDKLLMVNAVTWWSE